MIYQTTVQLTQVMTLVVHASYVLDGAFWGWTATAQIRGSLVGDADITIDSSYLKPAVSEGADIEAAVTAVLAASRNADIIHAARVVLADRHAAAAAAHEAAFAGTEVPF